MKRVALFGAVAIGLFAFGGAFAAPYDYSEVDIISVIPRSPDVKPVFMSVPADGHQKEAAPTNSKAAAYDGKTGKMLASADDGKRQSSR